jgi:heme-degrading monooxygenase HmoA
MVLTVFRSRFSPDLSEEDRARYANDVEQLGGLAEDFPGFVSIKTYTAEDGERVSLVLFDSEEAQGAWANLPAHREVQARGRERYYAWYRIGVYTVGREYSWP